MRNAIAEALDARGMSQKELAEAIGVHPISVGNWTSGRTIPQPTTRAKLTKFLGLTEEQLTGAGSQASEDNGLVEADAMHQSSGPISVTIKGHGLLVQMMVSIETARELLQTLMS